MHSISPEHFNVIAGSTTLLAFILGILAMVFYKKYSTLKDHHQEDIEYLQKGINSKQNDLNKMDMAITAMKSELLNCQKIVEKCSIQSAELEGKVEILRVENKKLLEAASDDITINVKSEQATVEAPRKRRPYKKRKPNGTTSYNPKMGKGKQRA